VTADEARDRFSYAAEGSLTGDDLAAFERVLDEDVALRAEYDRFRESLHAMRGLAVRVPREREVVLLAGVQRKIRTRSRGRYYRDRFASHASTRVLLMPLVLAIVAIGLLMLAYLGLRFVELSSPTAPSAPPEGAHETPQ
jgi:anti-sigma factor RsiW